MCTRIFRSVVTFYSYVRACMHICVRTKHDGILEAETSVSLPFPFRRVYIKMRNRGLPSWKIITAISAGTKNSK